MNRRDLFKLTGLVVPTVIPAQQQVPATGSSATWKPAVFDNHENQTVTTLVDLIIPATDTPGAKAAEVNRHMDHLLEASREDARRSLLEGLWWLDGYAMRKHGRAFVRCSTEQQVAILETLDANSEPGIQSGHEFFGAFKDLTARLYYATSIGFAELNKGGRVPPTFGCRHPEHR